MKAGDNMFLFRKNIILVPTDYDGISNTKGLLSFDAYSGKTICNLHCYNLDVQKPLLLGIAIQNRLHKIKIQPSESKNFNFDLDVEIKNGQNISVVLLNVGQSDYQIVLWGSTEINNNWQTALKLMLENEGVVSQKQSADEPQSHFENDDKIQSKQNFDDLERFDIIQQNVDKNIGNSPKNAEIEPNFDENANLTGDVKLEEYIDKVIELTDEEQFEAQESSNQNEKKFFDTNVDMPKFYQKISPQVEKLFGDNQDEAILSEIIPNSKFCKVDFDDGSGYYVFGIIYQNGLPKYLCYGLPAKKDAKPPIELAEYYQWLPIDTANEQDDGFYLMYQDAETGQNISVEII